MRLRHTFLVIIFTIGVVPAAEHGRGQPGSAVGAAPAFAAPQPAAVKPPADVMPPVEQDSVRFAIIGDSGTGSRSQYEIGTRMAHARQAFPFEFVIMLGDNLYGSERPQDFVKKFERPYEALLSAKVAFYAALGNHDDPTQRYYKPFNMDGERFYTFRKGDARFFVLDSNYMDQPQLKWLEEQLSRSTDRWKIAYFHHPLYSSGGRHGSEDDLRLLVEPILIKHGVDVVFAGHEHFYERVKPQKGIYYFTQGGSAKLRKGDIRKTALTAAGFDTDYSFMLAELGKEGMQFQVLSRAGKRVDSGVLPLMPEPARDDRQSQSR